MWQGGLWFADGLMMYRGLSSDNSPHAHATLQLTASVSTPITLEDEAGKAISGNALFVRPGVTHRVSVASEITLILLEPQSRLARACLRMVGEEHIGNLPSSLGDALRREARPLDIVSTLEGLVLSADFPERHETADPRLQSAMEMLKHAPLNNAISRAAESCGLSESRLRAIAQQHLGIPLSKWVLWCALARASSAMVQGKSLVDAAIEGGFSDQAHFTRTARRVLGVTPRQTQHLF